MEVFTVRCRRSREASTTANCIRRYCRRRTRRENGILGARRGGIQLRPYYFRTSLDCLPTFQADGPGDLSMFTNSTANRSRLTVSTIFFSFSSTIFSPYTVQCASETLQTGEGLRMQTNGIQVKVVGTS